MRAALLLLALALAACSADDGSSSDESRQLNQAAAKTDINATEPAK
jgi:ABC-type glycerol-3-phosphate transport system substrate-binding protein